MSPKKSPTSRRVSRILGLVAAAVLVAASLTACGDDESSTSGEDGLKVAAIFSGPTTDADYNALGLQALESLKDVGAEVAFSEAVPVPDIEQVLQEYVAGGYNVIWTHGSQFYEATAKIAADNPDVNFVGEFDGEPEGQPENVWVIDRNFHTVFYPIGALASALTKTGKVGYLGGLSLPFSFSEVHAVEQAIADSGTSVTLNPVWSGDFNDTVKAQQLTSQLLSTGNDVVITSLNLGVVGSFKAVNDTPTGDSWLTVKYTDKSQNGPEHYAATVLYDFIQPLNEVVDAIQSGETQGRYVIDFAQGATVQVGDSVPAEAKKAAEDAVAGISDGSITVEFDLSEVK